MHRRDAEVRGGAVLVTHRVQVVGSAALVHFHQREQAWPQLSRLVCCVVLKVRSLQQRKSERAQNTDDQGAGQGGFVGNEQVPSSKQQ